MEKSGDDGGGKRAGIFGKKKMRFLLQGIIFRAMVKIDVKIS